jgi:hypothetical protein
VVNAAIASRGRDCGSRVRHEVAAPHQRKTARG